MNDLLKRLDGGTLISDGAANTVADEVLNKPSLFPLLLKGLECDRDVVRARTAHALERISRTRPELLVPHLSTLLLCAVDPVPMVKWHVAMMLGNLATTRSIASTVLPVLLSMTTEEEGVFVRSWAIVSLARIGVSYPALRTAVTTRMRQLSKDKRLSISRKAVKTLDALEQGASLSVHWIKQ